METKEKITKIFVPQTFGKSFAQLKKEIHANFLKNGYGCSDHFKDKKNGYSIFYTSNRNFENGNGNGQGAGYYARLNFCGYSNTLKLSN